MGWKRKGPAAISNLTASNPALPAANIRESYGMLFILLGSNPRAGLGTTRSNNMYPFDRPQSATMARHFRRAWLRTNRSGFSAHLTVLNPPNEISNNGELEAGKATRGQGSQRFQFRPSESSPYKYLCEWSNALFHGLQYHPYGRERGDFNG